MKTVRNAILAGILAGALCGGLYVFLTYVPQGDEPDPRRADEAIESADVRTDRFAEEVTKHEAQTKTQIVYIREQVRREAGEMSPDALVSGVLGELELFRRAAGDNAAQGAAGVRDGGGGLSRERGGASDGL
jgi:hypothetical protein